MLLFITPDAINGSVSQWKFWATRPLKKTITITAKPEPYISLESGCVEVEATFIYIKTGNRLSDCLEKVASWFLFDRLVQFPEQVGSKIPRLESPMPPLPTSQPPPGACHPPFPSSLCVCFRVEATSTPPVAKNKNRSARPPP